MFGQVDVYDENSTNAPMIGSWSNLDLLFGMVEWLGIFQGGTWGVGHRTLGDDGDGAPQ